MKAIKQALPTPVKSGLRNSYDFVINHPYERKLKALNTCKSRLLILGTIARSGTHFTKFLIANYLKAYISEGDVPVSPEEMNSMFPNNWHLSYLNVYQMPFGNVFPDNVEKPTPLLQHIGIDDFTRSHALYQKYYWDQSPVLHLYRNPLDYAVSMYHYMHKNRPDGRTPEVDEPYEVLDLRFENYVRMFHSYRDAARQGNRKVLRISYEDIKRYPQPCLRIILRWLGVEPREAHVELAAHNSSIGNIKKMEKKGGIINPTAALQKGEFARDGSIGQWTNYFSNDQFDKVRARFKSSGISLNEFTLEP